MTEDRYRVVFSGDISEGKNQDQVILDMANLMKIDILKAQRLFDGHKVIVKSNISQETATEYVDAFAKIGAIAVSEQIPKPVEKPANSPRKNDPEIQPTQPKQSMIPILGGRVSVGIIIAMSLLVAGFIYLGFISYDF
jgi:hypothetical protein